MNISITIMASPERKVAADTLYWKLHHMPFSCITPVWDEGNGEWDTGRRAWYSHNDSDWHVVIQDDAIIGDTFYENIYTALSNAPEHNLVSFYTGTVRPRPKQVKQSVDYAKENDISWLTDKYLHWGVCFAMPTNMIDTVIKDVEKFTQYNYDNRIGYYFRRRNRNVYYTMPSLVNHNDDLPSLTGHDLSEEKRVAHWFVGDELVNFNNKTREIKL